METPKKQKLLERMECLHLFEEDIVEKFILGSGSGGQKINKTSSCVYIQHIPSGIEVKCQLHRSREKNRSAAREELCQRVENILLEEKKARQQKREKTRRQNRQPSRAQKARMVEGKRRHSEKKSRRKVVLD